MLRGVAIAKNFNIRKNCKVFWNIGNNENNTRIKVISYSLIIAITVLILTSQQAQSAIEVGGGCCLDASTGECIAVPSPLVNDETQCHSTGGTFTANGCENIGQCSLGCCCYNDGTAESTSPSSIWSCPEGADKRETTANANCNDICSIPAETVKITGQVTNDTKPLSGATVSVPNLDKQTITDSTGTYTILNIPKDSLQTIIASFPGCEDDNETINATEDTTLDLEVDCSCTPNVVCESFLTAPCVDGIQTVTCHDENNCQEDTTDPRSCQGPCKADNTGVTISDLQTKPRSKDVLIDWTYDSSCTGQDNIVNTVYRCDASHANCLGLGTTSETHYEDPGTNNLPLTTYCYQIQSQFYDGSTANSDFECFMTGDAQCYSQSSSEFCSDNKRTTCNAQNKLVTLENCGKNKFCLGPYPPTDLRAGLTECVSQAACDKCNGLFEMNYYLDYLSVFFGLGDDRELKACSNDDPESPGLIQQSICYLDRSDTSIDKYYSCGNVDGCGEYRSEQNCKEDPCMKNLDCQWLPIYGNESSNQLGLGICSNGIPNDKDCQSCKNLFGGCTQSNCELIGGGRGENCYFDALLNGLTKTKGCAGKEKIICRDYDSQDECEGGQAVEVDALYDTNKTRIAGNHHVTPSQDLLEFGKCYWDDLNQRCNRNADGLKDADCGSVSDMICQKDFIAPNTQLNILLSPLTYRPLFNKNVAISLSVSDNTYATNQILTFYCVVNETDNCYPNTNVLSRNGQIEETITQSGQYTIFYYSIDPAKNLEQVQEALIEVDLEPPSITLADVSEITESELNVTGSVTLDTVELCAENEALAGTNRCIVPCKIDPGLLPGECIADDLTFQFALPLTGPKSQETLNEIVFTARDEAGNTANNTLSYLLDLQGPGPPIGTLE